MEAGEMYEAFKGAIVDAANEGAGAKVSLALPLTPFRACRTLSDGDTDDVNVVGIRFDPAANEWKFVCVAHDSVSDIYLVEEDSLAGELPTV